MELKKQFEKDRDQGYTYTEIALKNNVSRAKVSRVLNPDSVRLKKQRNAKIIKDSAKLTIPQLMEKYNVTDPTIRRLLNKEGVTPKKTYKDRVREKQKKEEAKVIPTLARSDVYRIVPVSGKTNLLIYENDIRYNMDDETIIENYNRKYGNGK